MSETGKVALSGAFGEHCSELYWLAFLLTGDKEQSVQAFTHALEVEDAANPFLPNPFFQGWLVSWARSLVIAAALGTIPSELRRSVRRVEHSRCEDPSHASPPPGIRGGLDGVGMAEFERAVRPLDAFPRCALLLTVFEKLSIQDTARLLGADESLVRKAQGIGLVELTRNIARYRS